MISKCQIILKLYDEAINNKVIQTINYMQTYNISERTFRRYINELNNFFAENYMFIELSYSKSQKGYIIKKY